jgi:HSP20 family protein
MLVRYNPSRAAERANQDFGRFLNSFFIPSARFSGCGCPTVSVDIYEDEQALYFEAELPGLEKEAIKVVVEDGVLTISGERRTGAVTDKENYLRREIGAGEFSRSFTLPDSAASKGISADYKSGILSITIPKKEEAKPKEINVQIN